MVDNHPMVNDFRRDDVSVDAPPLFFGKGGRSHRSVDISVYLVENVFCYRVIHIRVYILGNCHAPDIVDGLLRGLGFSGKKGLAVLLLPFIKGDQRMLQLEDLFLGVDKTFGSIIKLFRCRNHNF